MVRIFLCLIGGVALTLSPSAFAFLTITATLDKNPVVVNESFVLTITADDDVNTNALDTSALMQHFIVGRTSVSSQTSMMNFKTSRTTKWTTVLNARKAGQYTIPPFTIENKKSQPIAITVLATSDLKAAKQQDLFITSEISTKELYVQQQVTLTVKTTNKQTTTITKKLTDKQPRRINSELRNINDQNELKSKQEITDPNELKYKKETTDPNKLKSKHGIDRSKLTNMEAGNCRSK